MEPDPILRALRAALSVAQQRRNAALERFDDVMRQMPSRIPPAGGLSERIRHASREYIRMRQEVLTHLARLNDYLAHGKIPPDLEGQERKPAAKETAQPANNKAGAASKREPC